MKVYDKAGNSAVLKPGQMFPSRFGFNADVTRKYATVSTGAGDKGKSRAYTADRMREREQRKQDAAKAYADSKEASGNLLYKQGMNPLQRLVGVLRPGTPLGDAAARAAGSANDAMAVAAASAPANTTGAFPSLPVLQAGGAPMPNIADYVGPYDNAMAKVREYAASATPEIQAAYDNLATRLAKYAAEGAAANTAAQAGTAARLQQGAGEVAGAYQANLDQLNQYGGSGLGSISAGAQSELAAAQAQFARQQAAQQDLLSNIGLQQAQAAQDRASAAEAARSQALTSKEVAMQAALSQLEGGRAQASRQYASDAAQASAAGASSANAAAQANFEMAMKLAQAKSDYASQQSDAYNKSLISGKDWLMNEYAFDAQQQMPQTWGAFESLLGNALKPDKNNIPSDQLDTEASDAKRLDWALGSVDDIVQTYKDKGIKIDGAALRRWLKIYFTPGNTMLSTERARANGYMG